MSLAVIKVKYLSSNLFSFENSLPTIFLFLSNNLTRAKIEELEGLLKIKEQLSVS